MRRLILTTLCLAATACATTGSTSPKVTIDRLDRGAVGAVRAFQLIEQASWQAKAGWDTPSTHRRIAVLLGGDPSCAPPTPCPPGIYDLIIDVANIGLALPPGATLSAADLQAVGALKTAVTDLVAIASPSTDPQVKEKASTAQRAIQALLHTVASATGGK